MPAAAQKPKPATDRLSPTLAAANAKLVELARLTREVDAIDSAAAVELEKLRERVGAKTTPLRKRIGRLESDLEVLMTKHRKSIFTGDRRSMKLAAGTIGFRLSTLIEVDPKTIELIEKQGRADEAIRIKKEVNKTVLQSWSRKDLRAVKAIRIEKDEFYHKLPKVEV
ncbi:MAG: host-nuclease inhibitor Gam family protein, partial [Leptospirales bacterium]